MSEETSISKWAEFADPEAERAFREWSLPEWSKEARKTVLIASALFCLYAIDDYAEAGPGKAFLVALALRVVGVLTGIFTAGVVGRTDDHRVLDRTITAFELSVLALLLVIISHLSQDATTSALGGIVIILGIYLFVPNRFPLALSVALVATTGFLLLAFQQPDASPAQLGQLVMVFLMTHAFGIVHAQRFQRMRRREYAELMRERRALDELRRQMADRAELESQLRYLATTDELTGAATRRYFLETAERELRMTQGNLSVLVIDIDYFKSINDTFGHAEGDKALKHIGCVIRSRLRSSDLFGRLGGEEFAVLARDADEETARALAERLRAAVASARLGALRITLSAGIACRSRSDQSIEDLLARADKALYAAKQGGRNRVMAA